MYPAGNYMFKINNRNTRTKCEICTKLTVKTPERRPKLIIKTPERRWPRSDVRSVNFGRHSGVFIVNFVHVSHIVLAFLLLTLSR